MVVLVGGSGDLSTRLLLPAFLQLEQKRLLPRDFRIVAVSQEPSLDDASYRSLVRQKLDALGVKYEAATLARLTSRLSFVPGSVTDKQTARAMKAKLGQVAPGTRPTYYFAVPPGVVASGIETLHDEGLLEGAKVVVEKPIGSSKWTAWRVNHKLARYLAPSQIFRMDHYLGKQGARNITSAKANPLLAPLFSSKYVASVEVAADEELGVERRAGYYDRKQQGGAGRDMLQSHLPQIAGLTLMALPERGGGANDFITAKTRALKLLRPVRGVGPDDAVRGQYAGYLDEDGVAADSPTETMAGVRLTSRDRDWRGVPIVLRTAKKQAQKLTSVTLRLKRTTPELARLIGQRPEQPADLFFEIDPKPRVTLAGKPIEVAHTGDRDLNAYASQLDAVLRGDHASFPGKRDSSQGWRIMGPVFRGWQRLGRKGLATYAPGTDRPAAVERLLRPPAGGVMATLRRIGRAAVEPVKDRLSAPRPPARVPRGMLPAR